MNLRACSTIVCAGIFVHWIAIAAMAQTPADPPTDTIELFNGKNLDGLKIYVDGESVAAADAWKVEEGILRATGAGKGFIRTELPYADYALHVEWHWPKEPGNSGVLVNMVNGDKLWPKGFECQLASGRAGEFASFDDARSKEEIVSRNPNGVSTGRLLLHGPSAEKPVDEWNAYDIVVAGDTITLSVNGVEVNRMTGVVPSAGLIGLQAEGTPVDFRNFTLTPLPPAKNLHAPMPKNLQ
jgi:3-keto-disaccharide hydrolase